MLRDRNGMNTTLGSVKLNSSEKVLQTMADIDKESDKRATLDTLVDFTLP